MAYQSINARKEEFRKYLEKNGVVDSITKTLVALYEEPERPQNPLEYIKQFLSGPSNNDTETLRQENEQLKLRIKELEERLNKIQGETQQEES
jgi:cell shape-determining protein MreC